MTDLIIETRDLEELKQKLEPFFAENFHRFSPFNPLLLHFCETLSQKLFQIKESKEHPDFIALAFWLRKSHLLTFQESFFKKKPSKGILSPIGVVFHIPPANIETMMIYSWICSLLVGNGNVIRIPSNKTIRSEKLLNLIDALLEESQFSEIRKMTRFIRYKHEESITTWISSQIDFRIIWGGDETIATIKKIALPSHAKELAFPDRFSFAVFEAETYLQASLETKELLASQFFNDLYWFDQSGCSSPRLIFWVGHDAVIDEASHLFYQSLQKNILQRKYELSLGGYFLKQNYMYDKALTLPVESVLQISNELTVLVLKQAEELCRTHCGQGLLYHVPIKNVEEIISFVTHQDQTMTYYGFSLEQLRQLALLLNGKGVTRIVPVGQALNFDHVWDGHDLFSEMSQTIMIEEPTE